MKEEKTKLLSQDIFENCNLFPVCSGEILTVLFFDVCFLLRKEVHKFVKFFVDLSSTVIAVPFLVSESHQV